eukprot:1513168-Ditylum_brightwellii.AAC.1
MQWKLNQDYLILRNNKEPYVWARDGGYRIINKAVQTQMSHMSEHDLKLALLFTESINTI